MNKIKLLFFLLITFFLSGCYTTFETTDTYAQTNACIYIDYNFYCDYCYYEMYWCPACGTYHVSINNWCSHHYDWYYNWYVVYYYHPYSYYYGHYTNHYSHRDYSRHYIRNSHGLRNYGNRKYISKDRIFKTDINLQKRYNETYKSKTYKQQTPNNRKQQQYKAPNNRKQQQYRAPNKQNTTKRNNVKQQKSTTKQRTIQKRK